jgi:hypothetical protein
MKCDLDANLCLFHDSAQIHTAEKITKLMEIFGWENPDHPPHCPDLVPSNFQLFPKMKSFGRQMDGN